MADVYGRTGGPFLDQLELERREIKSARIEGREPDFAPENLAPMAEVVTETPVAEVVKISNLEVDMNDPAALDEAISQLALRKQALEEGNSVPSSLLPGVVDPTAPNATVEFSLDD